MIATLLPLLVSILTELPQAIEAAKEVWALATQTTAPTPAEQTAFDAALDKAHAALQAS
jgi:hypothetical protein